MSTVSTHLSALAVSNAYVSQRLADRGRGTATEPRAAAVKEEIVVDMVQEMILDIESYKEVLNESLDNLSSALSDLDQGIASLDQRTAELLQVEAETVLHKQDDPLEQMYAQIVDQLNQYGTGALLKVQGEVSAEKALALLEG